MNQINTSNFLGHLLEQTIGPAPLPTSVELAQVKLSMWELNKQSSPHPPLTLAQGLDPKINKNIWSL